MRDEDDRAEPRREQCAEPCAASGAAPLTLDAFTALVDRLQHPLHVFLHGLVGDADQAYDLMQDTWRDAWRATQRGAPPFVAGSAEEERRRWVFQVAYHRGISALRRRRLIRWESLDRLAGLGAEPESGAASFEDRLAESEAVRQALARLAPRDAACLLLRLVEGFSAAEVGQIVGASAPVVTKRLARAKQRLRDSYFARNPAAEVARPEPNRPAANRRPSDIASS
ncbi:MAG TPA: sigma-70 family RNA polymerase sigma factor [Ktedonobacterales bacterium]|jgi:RNA polymerase sigma-70 factor (ECF subfamily)